MKLLSNYAKLSWAIVWFYPLLGNAGNNRIKVLNKTAVVSFLWSKLCKITRSNIFQFLRNSSSNNVMLSLDYLTAGGLFCHGLCLFATSRKKRNAYCKEKISRWRQQISKTWSSLELNMIKWTEAIAKLNWYNYGCLHHEVNNYARLKSHFILAMT